MDKSTEKRDEDVQKSEVTPLKNKLTKKKDESVHATTDILTVPEVAKALVNDMPYFDSPILEIVLCFNSFGNHFFQSINESGGEQFSDGQFGELMTMIRNAEKSGFCLYFHCFFFIFLIFVKPYIKVMITDICARYSPA